MDPEGGKESVERLRQAGNGLGKMYIIPHAGHHGESQMSLVLQSASYSSRSISTVYLDNPKATNDLLVKELDRAADLTRSVYSP